MTIDDRIRDEKLQYDINREAAETSAFLSDKIDKYEYLTGEEILPSNQKQIIEQAKFTYSSLGKSFEKEAIFKSFLMIILQWYLKQNMKQTKEHDLKY